MQQVRVTKCRWKNRREEASSRIAEVRDFEQLKVKERRSAAILAARSGGTVCSVEYGNCMTISFDGVMNKIRTEYVLLS